MVAVGVDSRLRMSRLTEHTRSRGTWRRAVGHPPPRVGAPALSGGELRGRGPPSLSPPPEIGSATGASASFPAPPDLPGEQRAGVDSTEVERILELRRVARVASGVGGTPSLEKAVQADEAEARGSWWILV